MERFRGKLLHKGKVVLDSISGVLEKNTRLKSPQIQSTPWSGQFEVPRGQAAQAGRSYDLVFADSRSGKILVRRSVVSLDAPLLADFLGCGPLHQAARN
jgi:hypothetical protein